MNTSTETTAHAWFACELSLLAALATGDPVREVAARDGGSVLRVRHVTRQIRQRLNATNNLHAVVLAVCRGLI